MSSKKRPNRVAGIVAPGLSTCTVMALVCKPAEVDGSELRASTQIETTTPAVSFISSLQSLREIQRLQTRGPFKISRP
jgi:hypothetical protein